MRKNNVNRIIYDNVYIKNDTDLKFNIISYLKIYIS